MVNKRLNNFSWISRVIVIIQIYIFLILVVPAALSAEENNTDLPCSDRCPSFNQILKTGKFVISLDNTCPLEGLTRVSCNGSLLYIEQQLYSGWYFVSEYFTFEKNRQEKEYYLMKYSRSAINRRNPDQNPVRVDYSRDNFGIIAYPDLTRSLLTKFINDH